MMWTVTAVVAGKPMSCCWSLCFVGGRGRLSSSAARDRLNGRSPRLMGTGEGV